jgi:hypothetical protein
VAVLPRLRPVPVVASDVALVPPSPATGAVFEDLLVPGDGLELVTRPIAAGETLHFCTPAASPLQTGDQLVVVRGTSSTASQQLAHS